MKSRTRTNKSRVLIAFGKGIASACATELAMLFLHGGSEVKTAIIDGGEDWVAEAPLKYISGHSALTTSHKPGWFYAGLRFDATILISPSPLTQQQLISGLTADPVIEFILSSGNNFRILQTKQLLPENQSELSPRFVCSELPTQPLKLSHFFQKIFAETTAALAAHAMLQKLSAAILCPIPAQIASFAGTQLAWVQRLKSALESSNIKIISEQNLAEILISVYDGPQIDPEGKLAYSLPESPDGERSCFKIIFVSSEIHDSLIKSSSDTIFIKRIPNGLMLFDIYGSRLLPDVTGQCCFTRLSSYLTTHLSRAEQKPGSKDQS